MKKLLIALGILLVLFAFASCNNNNQSLDDEVATTVAEELDPRTLVEKVLRDGEREGVDITYDLDAVGDGAKPSYTHILGVAVTFSGYEYSRVLTIESGRIAYTFYGTMTGTRFTSGAYELRTEEAMAVSGTSEGTVEVELSVDAREGSSGTRYSVTLGTDAETGEAVAVGTPSVSVAIPDDAVLTVGGTETVIPEDEPEYIPPVPTSVTVTSSDTADQSWYVEDAATLYVRDAGDLLALVETVNSGNSLSGKTIELMIDFDISAIPWVPIGEGSRHEANPAYFSGTIEGRNHVITGLNDKAYEPSKVGVDGDANTYAYGFIGMADGATIRNLIFRDASISAADEKAIEDGEGVAQGDSVGIVVGYSNGNLAITNCKVEGTSSVTGVDANGGIVGRAYGTGTVTITGCTSYATVTGPTKNGGILGINNSTVYTEIGSCHNYGIVNGGNAGSGGIVGYLNTNSYIHDCENSGTIGTSEDKYSGGIAGYATNSNTAEAQKQRVEGCTNHGEIYAGIDAGGIVGIFATSLESSSLDSCVNHGHVESAQVAGGIIGAANGYTKVISAGTGDTREGVIISNSENTATVHGDDFAGGVIGSAGWITIDSCAGGTGLISAGDGAADGNTGYAGRIIGSTSTSPDDVAAQKSKTMTLTIDDESGDTYDNIRTIGIMGPHTSWSGVMVCGGTFYGFPAFGNLRADIIFKAGTALVAGGDSMVFTDTGAWFSPDADGTWFDRIATT